MKNLIKINEKEIIIKEYQGNRVVTFKDIDTVHQRVDGTARKRFNDNKKRFTEKEDYFIRNSDEAKKEFHIIAPNGLILLTESGYLMLVKSLNDNLAWQVQRQLVKSYFKTTTTTLDEKLNDIKRLEAEARLRNSKVRESKQYLNLARLYDGHPTYQSVLYSKAAESLAGNLLIPLPEAGQKTYSANEIALMFGVSAKRIGMIANEHKLKTPEYGRLFISKSENSVKEVETWRYYESVIPVFSRILGREASAS